MENRRVRIRLRVLFAFTVIVGFVFASQLQAQSSNRPATGFQIGNTYALSDIETVNTTNGNLMFNIPMASLPAGRGGAGYTLNLHYNSKIWSSRPEVFDTRTPASGGQSCPQFPDAGYYYTKEHLEPSNEGGWTWGQLYELVVTNRVDYEGVVKEPDTENYRKNYFNWKVQVRYPDGSLHDFVPSIGQAAFFNDGYFNVDINGLQRDGSSEPYPIACSWLTTYNAQQLTTAGMNYFSTDGSFTRLFIPYQPGGALQGQGIARPWTLYMPDGTTVEHTPIDAPGVGQRITDRNGNKITFEGGGVIRDDLGRSIVMRQVSATSDRQTWEVVQKGIDGAELITQVIFRSNYVRRQYQAIDAMATVPPGTERTGYAWHDAMVVERIILPPQAGGLTYEFDYYGDSVPPSGTTYTTNGWGEMKSIVLPGGAKAEYSYQYPDPPLLTSFAVLNNGIQRKDLIYSETYDGATTPRIDTWQYYYGPLGGGVTGPDGSGSVEVVPAGNLDAYSKLSYRTHHSDRIVERIWAGNAPAQNLGSGNQTMATNPFVKTEFTSLYNSAGQPSITAIKDFNYDKNGNVTRIVEYDWVPWSSVPRQTFGNDPSIGRVTAIPTGASIKRITVNEYYNQTPDAGVYGAADPNAYAFGSSPRIKKAIKSTEVRDGSNNIVARSEFFYDDPTNKGNLIETRVWDSTKGAVSNPLTTANSISTTAVYDQYGMPLTTTDANNVVTTITYGCIDGATSCSSTMQNLYPTKTEVASNHAVLKRTSAAQYDFYTGLATMATDVDNNLSTVTEYDALGRPTKVRSAANTLLESWTRTEYDDVNRRVIVKADLETKEDGRKVATQFYDQLGRVRLSKTLEDAATQSPTNETDGIKVQTRYKTVSGYTYQLTSNPYRANYASNETDPTMGWTLSTAWSNGRRAEVQTFTGSALPLSFGGNNTNSTGIVRTDIDTNATTVTDQAGKLRRSVTNALGQLVRVDEPNDAGQLGSVTAPNQPTSYAYDTLNNLTTVGQGVQTRTFAYNSLSRLTSAANPESGTINYVYDNNGNLTSRTDARGVKTDYIYDALNRVTNRNYSTPNGTPGTGILANCQPSPNVTYFYDGANVAGGIANSKGKLTKVASAVSTTEYTEFDILGRVKAHKQTTDGNAYTTGYTYNLSGALIEETYPSGRVVKNTLDNDGSLQQVQSRRSNDTFRNYANAFTYAAAGAVTALRLGNGKWETTQFNSRLQPTQIGLGASASSQNLLKLNYIYNTNGNADNNGNVLSQTITVPTAGANQGFTATQTYTYDSLNRIKDAVEVIGTETWRQTFLYDRYGNRTFDTTANRTTTIPTGCSTAVCNPSVDPAANKLIGYQFDNSGNTKVDANGQTFIYDSENKQVKVVSGSQIIGEYFYDGDGKRIKKIVPSTGETTVFVYDSSGRMVAEYSTIVAPTQDAKVAYLTNDHLGSPRINTDAMGQTISRHDYRPFGEEIARTNYGQDSVRKKFTGYERDTESSLDFAEARYHSYNLGRFSSPDPLMASARRANPQTFNRYSYVLNNPTNLVDPLGMNDCDPKKDANCIVQTSNGPGVTAPVTAPIVPGNEFIAVTVTVVAAFAPAIAQAAPEIATQISARPLLPLLAPLAVPAGTAAIILGAPLTVNPAQECGINCQEQRDEAERTSAPAIPTTSTDTAPPPTNDPLQNVFRVFGGGSPQDGRSWTPTDPRTVPDYADAAGLPPENTMEFIVQGQVRTSAIEAIKPAAPVFPNRGGLIEYIINPNNVVNKVVSPFKPK